MIVAVTPSDKDPSQTQEMEYLLKSCESNNITINIIGSGTFTWLNRIKWFQEFLLTQSLDTIVCFTDAYDVFYLDNLETIRQKFLAFGSKIVWSAEKDYAHQIMSDKPFYDSLSTSPYRYLNGGTFIGYANALLELFNDVLTSLDKPEFIQDLIANDYPLDKRGNDQTWISHHLALNWKYDIRMDYDCCIFYVTSMDVQNIRDHIDTNLQLVNGSRPSIIHVPFKAEYKHILVELFTYKYGGHIGYFPEDTEYSHGYKFFKNGKAITPFGWGGYIFKNHTYAELHVRNHIFQIHLNEDLSLMIRTEGYEAHALRL
jgi:hypothetical protein